MNVQHQSVGRRGFLRGALAAAVLVPMGGTIASCAAGGGGTTTGPTGTVSDTNPFGMAEKATLDAVIFKGGYGIDYVEFAGKIFEKTHEAPPPRSPRPPISPRSSSRGSSVATHRT